MMLNNGIVLNKGDRRFYWELEMRSPNGSKWEGFGVPTENTLLDMRNSFKKIKSHYHCDDIDNRLIVSFVAVKHDVKYEKVIREVELMNWSIQ